MSHNSTCKVVLSESSQKNNPYAKFYNNKIYDQRISLCAVGLWSHALLDENQSYFTVDYFLKYGSDDRKTVLAILNELEKAGYAKKIKKNDENGKFKEWIYEFFLDSYK